MSKRIALSFVALCAACSGHLSMPSLLGGSTPAVNPSAPSSVADVATSSAGGGEDYDWASPPRSPTDNDLLTMPKFFQADRVYWATLSSPWMALWLADVLGDQLGEHARARLVSWCVNTNDDLAWAACTGDAHRLDRKRMSEEMNDPAVSKWRTAALANFDRTVKQVAERDVEIAKRQHEDPALKQMFTTIPAAAWKQWDAFSAKEAGLLAFARKLELASQKRDAMDEKGPSRKVFAGCAEQIAPYFTKAVHGTEQAAPSAEVFGTALTPFGYIATLGAYYCARGHDLPIAGALGTELEKSPWLRGPRMATIEMLIAKSKTLVFDDKAYSIEKLVWRDANQIAEREELYGENSGHHGVVKRVEHHEGALRLTFRTEQIEYPTCEKSERTGAWHYDSSSGNVEPVVRCIQWGAEHEMVDVQPIEVPATDGAAVQPGRYVDWQSSSDKSKHSIRAVWESPKQKKLLALFGIAR